MQKLIGRNLLPISIINIEMKTKVNTSIGIIKEDSIRMALEKNHEKRAERFKEIIKELGKHLVPVRGDRKYHRRKRQSVYTDPVSKKRSY